MARGQWPVACGALLGGAALVGLIAGCGYHLVGTGGTTAIPENLQKLHVAPFVNQTTRPELDQRLTEEITQEWVRRARFQLVPNPDQADVVLSGTVISAVVSPVQFDQQGRATEYQLSVAADVSFVDKTGPKPVVLWRDQRFSRVVSYEVTPDLVDYFDKEVQAIEQLAREFSRGLVVTILEGF